MGETISLDDYTTLPVPPGNLKSEAQATLSDSLALARAGSISPCIADAMMSRGNRD